MVLTLSSAAFEVSYESVSQFNREYGRFFGQPPMRDTKALWLAVAAAQSRVQYCRIFPFQLCRTEPRLGTIRAELVPSGALRPKEWTVLARQGYYRR